ncbi:MAG TPA: efflux RND transporter permease subunit [Candidatus Latescibacteria bacterium]|nr:efflux RND transporter permease subunit [Candidatus Latescibacterota bacterium]
MNLPEFSVNRKVTVTMLISIVVVLGSIALSRLGLDLLPEMDYPVVSVLTQYPGVAPEDIEELITRPIEEVASTVNRVRSVNSFSQEGVSVVMVEFEWGTNLDFASQDIRNGIGLIRDLLPGDITEPLVVKFNLSMMPVMFYGVTSEHMNTLQLRKLLKDVVKGRLERLDGVASVALMGGLEREVRVKIDKARLQARGLSLQQVVSILRSENLNLPAGHITSGYTEFLVRSIGEYEDAKQIANTVLAVNRDGVPTYLKDIADVVDSHKESRSFGRIEKKDSVLLMVGKQSGTNTLKVAKKVKKELARIKRILPPHVQFHLIFDQSDIIGRVTSRTANNAVVGGILAVLMILFFLKSWRPTLTIALAIPLSIMATFIAVYAVGYTLNLMTLGGLALGVGMLVDNAVVVIENIFRHLEEGKDRKTAAKIGASEVSTAITAATLTTVVVFLPTVFASGVAGKLSRGLALTVSFALFGSLFVALTLVPMIASILLKKRTGGEYRRSFGVMQFEGIKNRYGRLLAWALSHRKTVLGTAAGAFLITMALIVIGVVGTEFMPSHDVDFISMKVDMPVGTSLEETDRVVGEIEEIMMRESGVKVVGAWGGLSEATRMDVAFGTAGSGVNEAEIMATLYNKKDRNRSSAQIVEDIRRKIPSIQGAKFEFTDVSKQMMGGGLAAPVEVKIYGKDLAKLREISESVVRRIQGIKGLRDIDATLREGKPELRIRIDRDRAGRYGLTVGEVASTVQTAMQGRVAGQLRKKGDEIDIRVELKRDDRSSLEDLYDLPMLSRSGIKIPLRQVAKFEYGVGPVKIVREDQTRRVSVLANVSGRDLGSVMADVKAVLGPLKKGLPPGYFLEYGGEFEKMRETFLILGEALALAILLVYMVMAALFESFSHPLVIMFTMPLALIGVVLILLVTGKTISMVSFIGMIILAGIVVNNGIVLIDYVNQLRRRGIDKHQALIQGAMTRLRPILITAGTTILGMVPMAFSTSEGSEMRGPMALTVIGGLFAATLLTLVVVPVLYSVVDHISYRVGEKAKTLLYGEEEESC